MVDAEEDLRRQIKELAARGQRSSDQLARIARDIYTNTQDIAEAQRVNEALLAENAALTEQVAEASNVTLEALADARVATMERDSAQAEAELMIAQLTLKEASKEYRKTLERIAGATDLDSRVFGGPEGSSTPVRMFKDGPLAGKLAPANIGDSLTAAFHDRGSKILTRIELVTGTARTLSAGSADIGWLSIQGGMLAFSHPVIWAKAAKESIAAIGNGAYILSPTSAELQEAFETIARLIRIRFVQ